MKRLNMLTSTNLKLIIRQKSAIYLFLCSTFILIVIYLVWNSSRNAMLTFMTSNVFSTINIDLLCKVDPKYDIKSNLKHECSPYDKPPPASSQNTDHSELSQLVINMIRNPDNTPAIQIGKVINDIIMNGIPMIGLDDYVHLSDRLVHVIGRNHLKHLLQLSIFHEKFGNLFDIHHREIRLINTCWNQAFYHYLWNHTVSFKNLKVRMFDTMRSALSDTSSIIFAVIDIHDAVSDVGSNCETVTNHTPNQLSMTLRMHPSAITDTRNYRWTPFRTVIPRERSGELLYTLSGFISLQLEFQAFLTYVYHHQSTTDMISNVFGTQSLTPSPSPLIMAGMPNMSSAEILNDSSDHNIASDDDDNEGSSMMHNTAKIDHFDHVTNAISHRQLKVDVNTMNAISYDSTETLSSCFNLIKSAESLSAMTNELISSYNWSMISASYMGEDTTDSDSNMTYTLLKSSSLLSSANRYIHDDLESNNVRGTSTIHVPFHHRTFPIHSYQKVAFWHTYAQLFIIILVLVFTMPAAVCASLSRRYSLLGIVNSLLTLPPVKLWDILLSYIIALCIWILTYGALTSIFLYLILSHTTILIPLLALTLCGVAIGPIALVLSSYIKSSEEVIVILPTLAFITMLPGLLYEDLAFDIQRFITLELLICLLPTSATALILRHMCSMESLQLSTLFSSRLPVSGTPLYILLLMLIIDIILYMCFLRIWASFDSFQWLKAANEWNPFKLFYKNHVVELGSSADDIPVECTVQVQNLYKKYGNTEVLRNINFSLYKSQTTYLLGTNGAGKSTLMRLLCGIDSDYNGTITHHNIRQGNSRRLIGWCPQDDALYEYLTVYEHLHLYCTLIQYNTHEIPTYIQKQVERLGLIKRIHTQVYQLSGGIKRRLCLLLAVCGEPSLVLLDEPTTGCDSNSRELIRQEILYMNKHLKSTVFVSSHHMDDIELMATHIVFIDDKDLVYRGTIDQLYTQDKQYEIYTVEVENHNIGRRSEYQSSYSLLTDSGSHHGCVSDLVFTAMSSTSYSVFITVFPSSISDSWLCSESSVIHTNLGSKGLDHHAVKVSWTIPVQYVLGSDTSSNGIGSQSLLSVLHVLESSQHYAWSIASPDITSKLLQLYRKKYKEDQSTTNMENHNNDQSTILHKLFHRSCCQEKESECSKNFTQIYLMIYMRICSLNTTIRVMKYIAQYVLLPFAIVYAISYGCSDVVYPPLVLSSQQIGGLGTVSISRTDPIIRAYKSYSGHVLPTDTRNDVTDSSFLNTCNCTLDCQGRLNSDGMKDYLLSSYFHHPDNRWSAFIINDHIPDWMESTIALSTEHLNMTSFELYMKLKMIQTLECDMPSWFSPHQAAKSSSSSSSTLLSHDVKVLCDVNIDLTNTADSDKNKDDNPYMNYFNHQIVTLSTRRHLHATVTTMTNITSSHASPIFLKEIAADLFSYVHLTGSTESKCVGRDCTTASHEYTKDHDHKSTSQTKDNISHGKNGKDFDDVRMPDYVLINHPLPRIDTSSSLYTERGYLGASILILYMILTTVSSVSTIIKYRVTGMKLQLHLSGMKLSNYWIGHYCTDILSVWLVLLACYNGVHWGGNPVYSFYFHFNAWLFVLILAIYGLAVTSANYAFCVVSTSSISSQVLVLLSSIFNGMFLQLYLKRHPTYHMAHVFFLYTSPSYTFSTALLQLFDSYTTCLLNTSLAYNYKCPLKYEQYSSLILIMCIQSIVYFVFTYLLDYYWTRVQIMIQKVRHHVSYTIQYTYEGLCLLLKDARPTSQVETSNNVVNEHTSLLPPPHQESSLYGKYGMNDSNPLSKRSGHVVSPLLTRLQTTSQDTHQSSEASIPLLSMKNVTWSHLHNDKDCHHSSDASIPLLSMKNVTWSHLHNDRDCHQSSEASIPLLSMKNVTWSHLHNDRDCHHSSDASIPLLSMKNVTWSHLHNDKVCHHSTTTGIDASVYPGEMVAIIGMNGGGKTTLLRTLALYDQIPCPDSSIRLKGRDMSTEGWSLMNNSYNIGYISQQDSYIDQLKVKDLLYVFNTLQGSRGKVNRMESSYFHGSNRLNHSIISHKYDNYPMHTLSGGNKKKLAMEITTGTYMPSLLLVDECTSGVDPVSAIEIVDYLKQTHKTYTQKAQSVYNSNIGNTALPSNSNYYDIEQTRMTSSTATVKDSNDTAVVATSAILYTSHRLEECVELCERVILLHEGSVLYDGRMSRLLSLCHSYYQLDLYISYPYPYPYPSTNDTTDRHHVDVSVRDLDRHHIHVDTFISSFLSLCEQSLTTPTTTNNNNHNNNNDNNNNHNNVKYDEKYIVPERIIKYSDFLVRMTFDKAKCPLSSVLQALSIYMTTATTTTFCDHIYIDKYCFRHMNLEDLMAIFSESLTKS